MLKIAQDKGGDFEMVPPGVYTARCFKVIDLGTQTVEWAGEEKQQPKVMIVWEILDDKVKMQDGRPFAVTQTYTASLNEKSNLYRDLTAWRGKAFTEEELLGFDIGNLVGAYCQLQIVHNTKGERTYANINAIMNTKERPKGVNPDLLFDINNPDMDAFETFSEWLQNKIRSAEEWDDNTPESKPLELDEDEPEQEVQNDTDIDIKDVPF